MIRSPRKDNPTITFDDELIVKDGKVVAIGDK